MRAVRPADDVHVADLGEVFDAMTLTDQVARRTLHALVNVAEPPPLEPVEVGPVVESANEATATGHPHVRSSP